MPRSPGCSRRAPASRPTPATLAETSRDWWPLAMTWALEGQVGGLASVVCRPSTADEVAAVAAICNEGGIPLTVTAGRSGVGGGSVPVHGGVALDLCGLTGIVDVDDRSLIARVRAGTFGDHFEHELRTTYGLTAGPLAAVDDARHRRRLARLPRRRPALDPLRQDRGHRVEPRRGARRRSPHPHRRLPPPGLRSRPQPGVRRQRGHARHHRRGRPQAAPGAHRTSVAAPGASSRSPTASRPAAASSAAVPRPPCSACTTRSSPIATTTPATRSTWSSRSTRATSRSSKAAGPSSRPSAPAPTVCPTTSSSTGSASATTSPSSRCSSPAASSSTRWRSPRRGPASTASTRTAIAAVSAVDGVLAVSAHQSHAYTDGACLYFTFAGQAASPGGKDAFYRAVWDAGTLRRARRRRLAEPPPRRGPQPRSLHGRRRSAAASTSWPSIKAALDPNGILNPGKLGLADPFGAVRSVTSRWHGHIPWPAVLAAGAGAASGATFAVPAQPAADLAHRLRPVGQSDSVQLRPVLRHHVLRRPRRVRRRQAGPRLPRCRTAPRPRRSRRSPSRSAERSAARSVATSISNPIGLDLPRAPHGHVRHVRRLGERRRPLPVSHVPVRTESHDDHPRPRHRHQRRARRDRRPRRHHPPRAVRRVPSRHAVRRSRRVRRRGVRRPRGRPGAPGARDGGPVEAIGISNQRASTIVWDRATGVPVAPAQSWQDLRTIGDCLGLQAARPVHRAQPAGHQGRQHLEHRRPRPRPRPVRRHPRHLADLAAHRRASAHHRRVQRRDQRHDDVGWPRVGRPHPRSAQPADRRRSPASSTRRVELATATVFGAPLPICGVAGDQQASLIGQGAVRPGLAKITFGTGGMLDVCLGPDRPVEAARSDGGTFPIVCWQRDGEQMWGLEAIMLSCGTNVQWLRDDLGIIDIGRRQRGRGRRLRDRPTASCTCRRSSASAPRTGTTAPAARCSASPAAATAATSCGPCSRASPIAAPTSSRRPRPTPASASSDAPRRRRHDRQRRRSCRRSPTSAAGPSRCSPVRDATAVGAALLAGLEIGMWSSWDDIAATWRPTRSSSRRADFDRDGQRAQWAPGHRPGARAGTPTCRRWTSEPVRVGVAGESSG